MPRLQNSQRGILGTYCCTSNVNSSLRFAQDDRANLCCEFVGCTTSLPRKVLHGKLSLSNTCGFKYTPCHRTARCRCGPVARPVPPLTPIGCLLFTSSPSFTENFDRCRYSVSKPW